MVKSVKHLPHTHGDLSSYPRTQIKMPAMTAYVCKPRDSEMRVERGGSLEVYGQLAWLTWQWIRLLKDPILPFLNKKWKSLEDWQPRCPSTSTHGPCTPVAKTIHTHTQMQDEQSNSHLPCNKEKENLLKYYIILICWDYTEKLVLID